MDDLITRFWSRVERKGENECWPWLGGKDKKSGRGKMRFNGRQEQAPRVSWYLRHGTEASGHVCHSCDNPNCVNPAHLWVGTRSDNMTDSARKGRHRLQRHPEKSYFAIGIGFRPKGEHHGRAKITEQLVRQIRELAATGQTQAAIAKQFGLGYGHVSAIVRHKLWAHVHTLNEQNQPSD